jgi:hypothetical protein
LANAVAGVSYLLNNAEGTCREFNPSLHTSQQKLRLAVGNWPLLSGFHMVTVLLQGALGRPTTTRSGFLPAFVTEGTSLKRHLEECTKSWLISNAHRLPLLGAYEEIANEALRTETFVSAREILGGEWLSISKPWEVRRDSMVDILTKAAPFTFKPIVK